MPSSGRTPCRPMPCCRPSCSVADRAHFQPSSNQNRQQQRNNPEVSSMRTACLATAMLLMSLPSVSWAAAPAPLNPDTDPSRVNWWQLETKFGPAPDVHGDRFGVVLKTLTNEYWRLLAEGYKKGAAATKVKADIQAAQGESDQIGQLSIMENMVSSTYKGLLISPQTDANLQPAIDEAIKANIPVVNVDDAVVSSIAHFVGNVQKEN